MKSCILLLLLFITFTQAEKCFELNQTHSWSKGYTGLINVQADQLTTQWNLILKFSDTILSFTTWKGDTVADGNTYNITNKCYNGVIYSSQCLSIDFIVRHGYKDPPTIDQVTFNDDILPSCTQPLNCEVANSSEAAGCESCSKCPKPGVEGGYETYDHATVQFSQIWGNVTTLETQVTKNEEAISSTCSNATCEALETNVTKLQEELKLLKDAIAALQTPTVFSCHYKGPTITSTLCDPPPCVLAPYAACDVNVGSAIDKTSGKFTAPKSGKYRFTFMTLMAPMDEKKVICILVKTSGATTTNLARSVAQSKIGTLQEQITTTLDIIVELVGGDTIHVDINVKSGATIPEKTDAPYQTFFTGEFISA